MKAFRFLASFGCILGAAFMLPLAMPAESETEPPALGGEYVRAPAVDAESIRPLQVGDRVPNVHVRTMDGERIRLREALSGETSLLIFYRGGWCPYCTRHLAELATMTEEFEDHGVQVLGLSPDSAAKLAENAEEHDFGYTLLSDSAFQAALAFGVAFSVDDETNEMLLGYGLDLADWSGNEERILPVPAAFLIDEDVTVRFAHANPDYTVRLDASDLRAALDSLAEEPGPESAPRRSEVAPDETVDPERRGPATPH